MTDITVKQLKTICMEAKANMKTVVCLHHSGYASSSEFLEQFRQRLQNPFGVYYDRVQFFAIDLATDPDGMDGFSITNPENATFPAIWMIQGGLWDLNEPTTTLECIAFGPSTGCCFENLSTDITTYLWT